MSRTTRIAATAILTVVLGAALVGCSSQSKSADDQADAKKSAAPVETETSAPEPVDLSALAQLNQPQGQSQSQPQSGNAQPSNPQSNNPQPQTPSAPKPVIVSFETPENIDCHNGNFQNFTASWSTQNATNVTISIDGPGVYNTYAANGDTSLPFNCSTAHTFTLTANGPGGSVSRTITLQPRNVQGMGQPDPMDEQ